MSLPPPDDYIGEPGYPAPWTTSRPREALRDCDEARIICLAPDVCRSPKVPVPYMIYDTCGHDANYTPSVRFTGQKAMVLRSHTTHVHGDEPGVGKGVKSGTVGGISEPMGHASQVRAEGSPVIRHLDRFHMNNRNTVGEAIFVRDTATYPAPEDDDPVPGSIRLADGSGNWAQFAQSASGGGAAPQAAPSQAPAAPRPSPQGPPAPRPPGQVIRPDIPQWRRPPPTSLPSPTIGARLGRLGRFGGRILGTAGALLWPSPLADGTLPNWFHDLQSPDPFRRRTAAEAQRLFEGEPALRPHLEEWFHDETFDRPHDTPAEEPAERPAATPLPDNARVTEREDYRKKCEVGPYGRMSGICKRYGMQAHHIVPDWTLRTGSRADGGSRIPNMPSLRDGMAICVIGQARVEGDEHNKAHFADGTIEQLGLDSNPPYTATVAQVVAVSSTAMKAVRPDCAAQIDRAIAEQYAGRNPNQLLRAKQYPPLPAKTVRALKTGAVRSGSTRP